MGFKRARRNAILVPTHRPIPEPLDYGTEPAENDGAFVHTVGFNLSLFVPHVSLIRDQLKDEDAAPHVSTRGTMLYIEVRDANRLPGNALLEAAAALQSVLSQLERFSWRPPRRTATTER